MLDDMYEVLFLQKLHQKKDLYVRVKNWKYQTQNYGKMELEPFIRQLRWQIDSLSAW